MEFFFLLFFFSNGISYGNNYLCMRATDENKQQISDKHMSVVHVSGFNGASTRRLYHSPIMSVIEFETGIVSANI